MPPARSGSKNHRIARNGFDDYELSWQVEVKYAGSRILHHRTMSRATNRAGAEKFAKRWNVSMPESAPQPVINAGEWRPSTKAKPLSKTEIARQLGEKIDAHFKRIEPNAKLNPSRQFDKETGEWTIDKTGMGLRDFFNSSARGIRHRVWVVYVGYQGGTYLTIEQAEKYLAWLDAGNVGNHFRAIGRVR